MRCRNAPHPEGMPARTGTRKGTGKQSCDVWHHRPRHHRPRCVTELPRPPAENFRKVRSPEPNAPPLPMVRRSQSMGVHPRLGRGDAASGLPYGGGQFQAQREMTRLHIGNANLPHGPHFLQKFGTWNLELGTWNFKTRRRIRPQTRRHSACCRSRGESSHSSAMSARVETPSVGEIRPRVHRCGN
jgi:hypothetical protein